MSFVRRAALALAVTSSAIAQWSGQGWDETVANTSICTWRLPRVHVLRDTVFLDGGSVWWSHGLRSGEYTQVREDDGVAVMLTLNLTRKFSLNPNDNQTSLFNPIVKAGAGNNVYPVFTSGALLGNNAQFFLYGGLSKNTDAFEAQDADEVLEYQQFPYGNAASFRPGFVFEKLPDGVTRYAAYGAAVNVPSEQQSWYFSGLQSNTSGLIVDAYDKPELIPSNISSSFISVAFNPRSQQLETWENVTLPDSVKGRAGGEGVFVPVGDRGILVFVGGVTFPEFASASHASENEAALAADAADFVKTIDIYDIAGNQWYNQDTVSSETVPPLAQGCAVMQPAKDFSSFNIYYYGGYDAKAPERTESFYDDVWVLSLPSFRWIKAKTGDTEYSRAGHRCVSVYPDQMMVIGGWTPLAGSSISCTKGGPIRVLNLTSVQWMDGYDPAKYFDYGVPDVVRAEIGGNPSGGATENEPAVPGGWQNENLSKLFDTAYPTDKIETFYPYKPGSQTGRPDIPPEDKSDNNDGLPGWVAPVLGVVLGLVFVTVVLVAVLLWRRRRYLKKNPSTDGENSRNILSWIRGQPPDNKAVTETTVDEVPNSPTRTPHMAEVLVSPVPGSPVAVRTGNQELDNTQIHELPVPAQRVELHDMPLSPAEIVERHSRVGSLPRKPLAAGAGAGSAVASSFYSQHSSHNDRSSSVSQPSAGAAATGASSPITEYDGDPGVLPASERGRTRVLSGVSEMSAVDAAGSSGGGPLRPISEATYGSPISPPTASDRVGEDYITAISPIRKSFFTENADDMAERK